VSTSDPGLLFLDIAVKASIISSDVISESHIFLSSSRGIVIDVTKLENWKLELSKYEIEQSKGAILRYKAIWATEGDKNTKYFLPYLYCVLDSQSTSLLSYFYLSMTLKKKKIQFRSKQ
jgi:hypothetical protein